MKIGVFIKNTAILVVTALLLRSVGIVFKIYLAEKIGSEGLGLYQLIFSVYMLAATFATSGISTAVTRLVSENTDDKRKAKYIMKKSAVITLVAAGISAVAVFFGAEFIAIRFIGDIRAVPALKILTFSLPFMGLSSCIRGYFIAHRKTFLPSLVQISEQTVRIATVLISIAATADKGIKYTAAAVLFGDTVAETVSFLINYILYKADVNGAGKPIKDSKAVNKILKIALPVSGSSYLSSLLHTAENLLVPLKLTIFHGARNRALELFGAVRSMALPVLFFPASFLTSLSTMLIPEVSSANAKGDREELKKTVKTAVGITVVLSIFVAVVFLFNADKLSELLYNDSDVGFAMKILAPIVPFMYLESVTAGILKGLDQQVSMFKYNLCDSVLRIGAVVVILPLMGIKGYLLIMMVSNCFTSSFSYFRLCKVTDLKTDLVGWIIKPVCFALVGAVVSQSVYTITENTLMGFVLAVVIQTGVFFGLLAFLSPSLLKPVINKIKKRGSV